MVRQLPLLLALVAVVIGPILLRPKQAATLQPGEETLVIITPHAEATRYEFGRAFAADHLARTGRRVRVDWRTPGGTSEITRYVDSEFLAAFQYYWTGTLHRPWSRLVETSFADRKIIPGKDPALDTPPEQARRAFLDSSAGCKIDLFFGGGAFDFQQAAAKGQLVDCGFVTGHPELFGKAPGQIPQTLGGETFWDTQGRWVGCVISSFGICYNTDELARRGISPPPSRWVDLTDPRYLRGMAIANPTQSSSVNRSFEMLIQQQMLEAGAEKAATPDEQQAKVAEGWTRAMRLLMKIAANARYFTDSSTKIALDVDAGEAAAGMTIDFYGRFQSEAVRRPDGSSRLQYANAIGGSSISVDPIALYRGAPHPELAKEFIAFTLSPEGQKLWNWKVGSAGGPEHYALRRLPILPALYAPEFKPLRSDPDVVPYDLARQFVYHGAWTGPLFRPIAFIFRVMCIDAGEELKTAWEKLIAAGFPPQAMAAFEDVSSVDYAAASGRIQQVLNGDKIHEVQLAKELADHFRAQYQRAGELADRRQ